MIECFCEENQGVGNFVMVWYRDESEHFYGKRTTCIEYLAALIIILMLQEAFKSFHVNLTNYSKLSFIYRENKLLFMR